MLLVPKDFQHKKAQLLNLNFATAGSTSVAAATGLRHIPVYWRISASAAGSMAIYAGTAGSELIRSKFIAGANDDAYFWDNDLTSNKALVLEVEGAVGVGQAQVWYITVRRGAGSSGTGL